MKKLFCAMLFLGGLVAQAAPLHLMSVEKAVDTSASGSGMTRLHDGNAPGEDKFQQVLDFARDGQPVTFSDVEGVYTGRCYSMVQRNFARAAGVAIIQVEATPNRGPVCGNDTEKLVIQGHFANVPEDFDSASKEAITSALMTLRSEYSSVVENPLSVILQTYTTIPFVKNGDYVLTQSIANVDLSVKFPNDDARYFVKKGDAYEVCYYSNKK